MVRALLSIGAVLMLGWLISTLTAKNPKPVSPSLKPIAASRVTGASEETGGSSPNAAVPSLGVTNYPPKILSVEIFPPKPHIGDELEARAEAFDPDGDPVQLSYSWVVNGEIVTKGAGPDFSGSDLHKHDRVVVRVVPSDGKLIGVEGSSQPVMITNRPPLITSAPSTTMKGGVYTYTVTAKDPDGDSLQFRLSQAPEGMTIQPETGLIQWKVSTEQPAVDINVIASDGDGAEAFQQFKLTVRSGS
jgi:Putative Ig domain